MPKSRKSLGAAASSASFDDPVVIHSTEQLDQMQQHLLDHLQATRSANGHPLTRAQRAILLEKRNDFVQSVFSKVRASTAVSAPPKVSSTDSSASPADAVDEKAVSDRIKQLEKSLTESVNELQTLRSTVPDFVEDVLWGYLQLQSQPIHVGNAADDQTAKANALATLRHLSNRKASGSASSSSDSLPPLSAMPALPDFHYDRAHYSADDAQRLQHSISNWGRQASLLANSTLPKRSLNLRNVREYLENGANQPLAAFEQLLVEGTSMDPGPLLEKMTQALEAHQHSSASSSSASSSHQTSRPSAAASSASSASSSSIASAAAKRKAPEPAAAAEPIVTGTGFAKSSKTARTPVRK